MTTRFFLVLFSALACGSIACKKNRHSKSPQEMASPGLGEKDAKLLGAWRMQGNGRRITLQFDGESTGGTYQQLTEGLDGQHREFGHWIAAGGELSLIILATDTKNHPNYGESIRFSLSHPDVDSIRIDGPRRKAQVFKRAPKGTRIDISPE